MLVVAVYLLLPRTADPATGESVLDQPRTMTTALSAALLIGALWLLGWSLVRMTTLPVIAGLVVVAVTATSLGLYGATKLALEAKSLSVQPQVVAKFKSGESGETVELAVKAGHFRGRNLLVDVTGVPRGQTLRTPAEAEFPASGSDPLTIWSALLKPDALDEIDQTIEVPLSARRWTNLKVSYCGFAEVEAASDACREPGSRLTVVDVRNGGAEPGLQQITADIGPSGDDKLRVSFTSSDVAPGLLTKVELCRTEKGKHTSHVADATLAPDATGTITWQMTVPAGAAGDQLLLRHRSCPPGSPCAQEWQTLATYVME